MLININYIHHMDYLIYAYTVPYCVEPEVEDYVHTSGTVSTTSTLAKIR